MDMEKAEAASSGVGLAPQPWRRDRMGEHTILGRKRDCLGRLEGGPALRVLKVGLSRGSHLLLEESLTGLQTGSCSQGLGELVHLSHIPLLHVLLHLLL